MEEQERACPANHFERITAQVRKAFTDNLALSQPAECMGMKSKQSAASILLHKNKERENETLSHRDRNL